MPGYRRNISSIALVLPVTGVLWINSDAVY